MKPTPLPVPTPDWMVQPHINFYGAAMPTPIEFAFIGNGGSELRWQWTPADPDGPYVKYIPEGKLVTEWLADDPRVVFEGEFENKRLVSAKPGVSARIWIRFWDENGFMWDSTPLPVES